LPPGFRGAAAAPLLDGTDAEDVVGAKSAVSLTLALGPTAECSTSEST